MRSTHRPVLKTGAALGLTTALVVSLASLSHGDVLKNTVAAGGGVGQKLEVTVGTPVAVPYYIQATGGSCDAADGSPADVTVTAPQGATVNGGSTATLTFTACDVPQSVSFAVAAAGTYAIPAATVADSRGSYTTSTTALDLVASPASVSAPVNQPPTVTLEAADALVQEGDTITVTGAFADPDGDALVLNATSLVGTFTDHGNGTWTFTLPTNDDVAAATVLVTATDTHGATVTDDFDYAASNVAPSAALAKDALSDPNGCTLSVSPSWSDPGTADTHTGVLSWGDGTAEGFSVPGPLSHSFASAGAYTVSSTVTDDDGGAGTAGLAETHRVYNKPSSILQPVNDTRLGQAESQFKLGSTIPIKITVASCGEVPVSTLAPTVSVSKAATSLTITSVETVSTATPTTGTAMRYDASGAQYIYNLSTKNLTEGRFQITITDPTFASPVTATVTLKK